MTIKKAIIAVALFAASSVAFASKPVTSADESSPARASGCTAGGLKVATGIKGLGYAKLYKDIVAVCGSAVPMCEVASDGGLDNLTKLSSKKADIGFAQVDTIRDMGPGDENIAALQNVFTMNYNYLHVLTAAAGYKYDQGREWYGAKKDALQVSIRKFSDLKGKTVALVGSAQLLGQALSQRQLKDYGMRFITVKTLKEGLASIKNGQAQAVWIVSGAPAEAITALTAADGITMVNFDEDLGGQYVVRKLNYKNINVFNLKALAIPNVLVTRPFGTAKATAVAALRQCVIDNHEELKDGDYEPAWNEMKLDQTGDMPKFQGRK